jgi:hypothetical protein
LYEDLRTAQRRFSELQSKEAFEELERFSADCRSRIETRIFHLQKTMTARQPLDQELVSAWTHGLKPQLAAPRQDLYESRLRCEQHLSRAKQLLDGESDDSTQSFTTYGDEAEIQLLRSTEGVSD